MSSPTSLIKPPQLDLACELARSQWRTANNPHLTEGARLLRLEQLLRLYQHLTPAAQARCDFQSSLLALGEGTA